MSLRSTAQLVSPLVDIFSLLSDLFDHRLLGIANFANRGQEGLVERKVDTFELDLRRHAQQAHAVEDLADDEDRDEAEQEHQASAGEIAERIDLREALIGRGRRSPQHETRNDHAHKPAVAMYRNGAHRIVDLEAVLDKVMQLVGDGRYDRADQ